LFVCLLATLRKNFPTETSKWIGVKFLGNVGNGPMNKWLNFGGDLDLDKYRDTGKTCLGGGMHCPSFLDFILWTCCNTQTIWSFWFTCIWWGTRTIFTVLYCIVTVCQEIWLRVYAARQNCVVFMLSINIYLIWRSISKRVKVNIRRQWTKITQQSKITGTITRTVTLTCSDTTTVTSCVHSRVAATRVLHVSVEK